jgi:hypothetical protein
MDPLGRRAKVARGGPRSRLHPSRLEPAYPGTLQHAQNCVRDNSRTCCAVAQGRNGKLGRGMACAFGAAKLTRGLCMRLTLTQRPWRFPEKIWPPCAGRVANSEQREVAKNWVLTWVSCPQIAQMFADGGSRFAAAIVFFICANLRSSADKVPYDSRHGFFRPTTSRKITAKSATGPSSITATRSNSVRPIPYIAAISTYMVWLPHSYFCS